jgi:hypothetical protein
MIDQISEDIARLKTRREPCRDPRIPQLWKEEIARPKKLEKTELKSLVAAIRVHHDLAQRLDLIHNSSSEKALRWWSAESGEKQQNTMRLRPRGALAISEATVPTAMRAARSGGNR